MANLTKYDVAAIGIKLLIIYFALEVILRVPVVIFFNGFTLVLASLVFIVLIISWFFAGNIARFITKQPSIPTPSENNNGIKSIEEMLFRVVGVFVFITTLPSLIDWIYRFMGVHGQSELMIKMYGPRPAVLVIILLKLIFSIILMFTAKGLTNLFHKLRYAGHSR